MNAEEIYKNALRDLANEGNEKAKFALALGSRSNETSCEVRPNVINALQSANDSLLSALRVNGDQWSNHTDDLIESAQKHIIKAISFLARA